MNYHFFKNGGLNDVIEGYFFKNRRKNIPKSCSNESDELINNIAIHVFKGF